MRETIFQFAQKTVFKKRYAQLFFLFLFVLQFALVAQPARAGVWGESFASQIMKQAFESIATQLQGALLGTLKVTANAVLGSQVAQMIGGTSVGDALFVTDWHDFIYTKPAAEVNLYMNDYLTRSMRGKESSNNYVGVGDTPGSVGGNYPTYLMETAKQAIGMDESGGTTGTGLISYDLDQYCASPDLLFKQGDFMCLNSFVSNPGNNPFGFTMAAAAVQTQKMNEKVEEAKTKAQSSGFVGKTDKSGKTIAPAATVESMLSDVQNVGNNMIAAATNPGEFLTGVVSAVVNKAVTGIIQKGVGKIQASIQKEVKQLDKKTTATLDKVNKELGPGAKFTKEWSQKTDVYVKPYTQAPPAARDDGVYCGGAC